MRASGTSFHSDSPTVMLTGANGCVGAGAETGHAEFADAVVNDPGVDVAGHCPGVVHIQEDAALLHVGQRVVVNVNGVGNVGLIVR